MKVKEGKVGSWLYRINAHMETLPLSFPPFPGNLRGGEQGKRPRGKLEKTPTCQCRAPSLYYVKNNIHTINYAHFVWFKQPEVCMLAQCTQGCRATAPVILVWLLGFFHSWFCHWALGSRIFEDHCVALSLLHFDVPRPKNTESVKPPPWFNDKNVKQ